MRQCKYTVLELSHGVLDVQKGGQHMCISHTHL